MKNRKDTVLAVLVIVCVTAALFAVIPSMGSTSIAGTYNPWLDWNDDGKIDIKDVSSVAKIYGTNGDPVNKTALLIETNATFTALISEISAMNSSIETLNSTYAFLETKVDNVETDLYFVNGSVVELGDIVGELNGSLEILRNSFGALNQTLQSSIDTLNQTLQNALDEMNASLGSLGNKIDDLNQTMVTLESKVNALEDSNQAMQARLDDLNATLLQLQFKVFDLEGNVTSLQSRVDTLETRIDSLNQTVITLNNRVNTLEANYSVTNMKLAPYAIPFNMTYSIIDSWTTETAGFVDMPYTSVTLTLNRTSQVLIMFSANAWMTSATANQDARIKCRAVVNGSAAVPSTIELTPTMSIELGDPYRHSHRILYTTCSFNFYTAPLGPGIYTIKMQWYVTNGRGDTTNRTLIVMALPA